MLFPYRDDNPRILIPYVTYGIIAANTVIFLFQLGLDLSDREAGQAFVYAFGLIPAQFSLLNVFTSMFLHGGLAHIVGNMWFLWIFGDNVEGAFGHVRYALFYLLCGVVAGLTQVLINTASQIPMVGASGAIAGVLGAYMLRYPRAKVHVLAVIIFFITTFRVPAYIVLGLWFLMQLTGGLSTLGLDTTGGVAWFAHVGGFVAGVGIERAHRIIRIV